MPMEKPRDKQESLNGKKKYYICLVIFCSLLIIHFLLFGDGGKKSRFSLPQSFQRDNSTRQLQPTPVVHVYADSNVTQRLRKRAEYIRHTCPSLTSRISKDEQLMLNNHLYQTHYVKQQRVIVDHKLKLAVCIQAKGGSSFWKNLFLHRVASVDNFIQFDSSRTNTTSLGFVSVAQFQTKVSELTDRKYVMFTFGRNPWNRLVSLYRQKIEGRTPNDSSYKYVRAACIGKPCDTFQQVLECVLYTWKRGLPDRHWEPLTTRCDICTIPYHYFGRVELMNEEITEIFRQSGVKGNITSFLHSVREQAIREVEVKSTHVDYRDYYRNIPQSIIDDLSVMYRLDIQLLGYPDLPL